VGVQITQICAPESTMLVGSGLRHKAVTGRAHSSVVATLRDRSTVSGGSLLATSGQISSLMPANIVT
jgi:hypothetical protein